MQAADHNLILRCLPYVETAAEVTLRLCIEGVHSLSTPVGPS